MLSGKYEEDFESTLTGDAEDASTIKNQSNEQAILAGEAIRTGTTGTSVKEMNHGGDESTEERQSSCETSEDEDNTLTVSFNDIGTLRRSLERDEIIRGNLAGSLMVIISSNSSSGIMCGVVH